MKRIRGIIMWSADQIDQLYLDLVCELNTDGEHFAGAFTDAEGRPLCHYCRRPFGARPPWEDR